MGNKKDVYRKGLILECQNYDLNDDPNGAKGIDLAERAIKEFGSLDSAVKNIEGPKKEIVDIINRSFPPTGMWEHVGVREFQQRFSELRKAGYDLKPYSKMNLSQSRRYYEEIKHELSKF